MTNKEKYIEAFKTALEVTNEQCEGLKYQQISNWDSVGHMNLIAVLEELFEIMLDTEDIIDFSSFEKGKEILKKYDVEVWGI